jgi:hypothetical protein
MSVRYTRADLESALMTVAAVGAELVPGDAEPEVVLVAQLEHMGVEWRGAIAAALERCADDQERFGPNTPPLPLSAARVTVVAR